MANLLGNSVVPNYVKLTAAGILGCTYLAALAVALDYYLLRPDASLPSVISLILGTGLSMALGSLGFHQGAQITEHAQTPGGTTNASP